jgi:acetyl-CoA/propionyl-CoA carboxylase carboxyl transferase subunit
LIHVRHCRPITWGEDAVTRFGPSYHWIAVDPDHHQFLRLFAEPLGLPALRVWTERNTSEADFDRISCAGLVTASATIRGRRVAIVWSDFRVNGGCYGQATSRRFVEFLREVRREHREPLPLLFFVNSAGISLMEGRRVFSDAFAIWPELLAYSEANPVLTCALGKCLGLAPLLFGLGSYRMAVAGQTHLNLTGPEVISMFFGEKLDFAACAAAERFHACNDLVHEIVPSLAEACARMRSLIVPVATRRGPVNADATTALLGTLLDAPAEEVIPGWCDRLRLFVGIRHGRALGLFVNPPDRSNNLITTRTLEKYAAGLDLFRSLGFPIVSFLDSPGIDPRIEQSDANNFRRMLWVGEKIIRYPHGSMGVITRRCFGGATTLVFPKVFGGARVIALRTSDIGAMHPSIVTRVLKGSPRLARQWEGVVAEQGPDLRDLLSNGSLDAVIDRESLPAELDLFLTGLDQRSRTKVRELRRRAG